MKVTAHKTYWCMCGKALHPHVPADDPALHQRGNVRSIEVSFIEHCCDKMKRAYGNRFIIFGTWRGFFNTNTDINIISTSPSCGTTVTSEMLIELCPWCGESIHIEVLEEEPNGNTPRNYWIERDLPGTVS